MEQNQTLLMMRGLPLSGKTEWATRWANEHEDRLRLSWTDVLRMMGGKYTKHRRGLAFESVIHTMMVALRQGRSVVIDEENLNPKDYDLILTHAEPLGIVVQWHTMEATETDCIRRNHALGCPLQDADIHRKAERFKEYLQF